MLSCTSALTARHCLLGRAGVLLLHLREERCEHRYHPGLANQAQRDGPMIRHPEITTSLTPDRTAAAAPPWLVSPRMARALALCSGYTAALDSQRAQLTTVRSRGALLGRFVCVLVIVSHKMLKYRCTRVQPQGVQSGVSVQSAHCSSRACIGLVV